MSIHNRDSNLRQQFHPYHQHSSPAAAAQHHHRHTPPLQQHPLQLTAHQQQHQQPCLHPAISPQHPSQTQVVWLPGVGLT